MNDKYVFETESLKEMELIISRYKMLSVLDDIKNWRREIYKGYDNNISILYDGKLYTHMEFEQVRDKLPKDEYGRVKNCRYIYLQNDLIDKIDDLLYEVNHLLD